MRGVAIVLLLVPLAARAAERDDVPATKPSVTAESRDGLLNESSALPASGTFRVHASALGSTSAGSSGQTALSYAFAPRWLATVAARGDFGRVAPAAGARVQLFDEATSFANVTLGGAFRSWAMMESSGSQGELRLAVGRRFGPLLAATNVAVAQGFAGRDDTDFEGTTLLSVIVAPSLRLGGEGRIRFELADRDIPNEGREYEAFVGGTAYLELSRFQLQALAGWASPRGFARSGPAAGVAAIFEL